MYILLYCIPGAGKFIYVIIYIYVYVHTYIHTYIYAYIVYLELAHESFG
jgi:hypothetical protein